MLNSLTENNIEVSEPPSTPPIIKLSSKIIEKLDKKHQVTIVEAYECFENCRDGYLIDQTHPTTPPSQWFVATTNQYRSLKIVFIVLNGKHIIKTAYETDNHRYKMEIKRQQNRLNEAITKGDLATVQTLTALKIRAPMAVRQAAKLNQLEIIKIFHGQKYNLLEKDVYGWNPLHWAAKEDSLEVIEYFYQNFKDALDTKTPLGFWSGTEHPLHIAIRYKSIRTATFFINQRIGINSQDQNGWTPLTLAYQNKIQDVVRLLMTAQADLNLKTKDGLTLLHIATTAEDIAGVTLLLQHGANAAIADTQGNTPLDIATKNADDGIFFKGSSAAKEIVALLKNTEQVDNANSWSNQPRR